MESKVETRVKKRSRRVSPATSSAQSWALPVSEPYATRTDLSRGASVVFMVIGGLCFGDWPFTEVYVKYCNTPLKDAAAGNKLKTRIRHSADVS